MIFDRKKDKLARQLEQMKLIHVIGLQIVSVSRLDKLMAMLVSQTRKALGYDNISVFLAEGDKLVFRATTHHPELFSGLKVAMGEGIIGRCAENRRTMLINDISRVQYYIRSGLKGVAAEIATPIIFGERLIGVLTIESKQKDAFSEEDVWVVSILGSQLGVAIHNLQVTRARIREMEALHAIGLKIASKIELDELLETIVSLARNSLGYDYSGIFLLKGDKLVLNAHSNPDETEVGIRISMGQGVIGRCAQSKQHVYVEDVTKCDFYIESGLKGVGSALALPIMFENRLMGVFGVESRMRAAFRSSDRRLLTILCAQIGVALRNAEMLTALKNLGVRPSKPPDGA